MSSMQSQTCGAGRHDEMQESVYQMQNMRE